MVTLDPRSQRSCVSLVERHLHTSCGWPIYLSLLLLYSDIDRCVEGSAVHTGPVDQFRSSTGCRVLQTPGVSAVGTSHECGSAGLQQGTRQSVPEPVSQPTASSLTSLERRCLPNHVMKACT